MQKLVFKLIMLVSVTLLMASTGFNKKPNPIKKFMGGRSNHVWVSLERLPDSSFNYSYSDHHDAFLADTGRWQAKDSIIILHSTIENIKTTQKLSKREWKKLKIEGSIPLKKETFRLYNGEKFLYSKESLNLQNQKKSKRRNPWLDFYWWGKLYEQGIE